MIRSLPLSVLTQTLPLRLRWEQNENLVINRNAVVPMFNSGVFHLRFYATGTTLSGLRTILTASTQGSRNGNLGLEGGTALRL